MTKNKGIESFAAVIAVWMSVLMVVPSFFFLCPTVTADSSVTHDTDKDFSEGSTGSRTEVVGNGAASVVTLGKSESWERAMPLGKPSKVYMEAMVYEPESGLILTFGGYDASFNTINTTLIFNTTNGTWFNAFPFGTPPRRYSANLAFDTVNKVAILYGGYGWGTNSCNGYCTDTWAYNFSQNSWTKLTPVGAPGARSNPGMAYDKENGKIVLFGGANGAGYLNDLWLFDYKANTWTNPAPASPPPVRYSFGMVYNPSNTTILAFGGYNFGGYLDDLWEYNTATNTWTMLHPASKPPARYSPAMAWDDRLGTAIVFGGYQSSLGYLNDTWTYNPNLCVWSQVVSPTSPPAGYGMRMVYNAKESVDIMYGGYYPGFGTVDWTYYYGDLFHSSGNYTSATIDSNPTGTLVNWVNISVKATLNEGEVAVTVSANDDGSSWYYVGPDGTILTKYTKLDGETLWSGLDGQRYLRYMLHLKASNPIRSPTVDRVSVMFNRLPLAPVLNSPSHFAYVTVDRPTFNLSSKELDSKDKLRYSLELSTDNFNTILKTYDWTTAGWSAQDYASDAVALFTVPTGQELVNGKTYQWRARAFDGRDWSLYSVVWWFTVDTTPPEAPYSLSDGLGNDIQFTGSTTTLSAHWDSAGDPESGITAYWFAIGTTPGGTEVKDFTDNGIRTAVTVPGLTLLQGTTYYFSVKAQNGAGLFSPAVNSNGQTVDTTAPAMPLVKDEGEYTNRVTEISATWFSTDGESGIVENRYSLGTEAGLTDVVNWTSIGGANSITHSSLNLTEGTTYYLSVKTMNQVGDWSNIGSSDGITVDVSAPYDLSLSLSGKAGSTNRTTVTLKVGAKDKISGLSMMQFSNDGTTWSGWMPYSATKDWTLSQGDGSKTVYLQVMDKAGNAAGGASVAIILDTTRPAPPTIKIDGGAKTTNSTNVILSVESYDATSGIAEMSFSQDGWQWEDWNAYSGTTYFTLMGGDGTRQVFVKVRDGAGNEAGPVNASIIQDTQPPMGGVLVINDNAAITQSTTVHLRINAVDATSGLSKMSFSNDKTTWSPWETYSTDKYWQLGPTIGVQTVSVRIMDAAGNVAPMVSDSIAYGQNTMYLTITKPAKNAKVSGTIKITGTAISDTPVSSVQVRMDGGVWKEATGGRNWSYEWDTTDYPDGVHVIEVRAQNNLGYTISDPVEVKVTNKSIVGFGTAAEVGGLILLIFAILVFSLAVGFVIGRKPGTPLKDEALLDEDAKGTYPEEKVPTRRTPPPEDEEE